MAQSAERVRRADPERFQAVMACPAALRAGLWALYALNLEIGRAAWASTEPMIGEMRLQWWVDALNDLAQTGQAPNHELGAEMVMLRPVATRMADLADSRRRDCWRETFSRKTDLWQYLHRTSGTLFVSAGLLNGATLAEADLLAEYGAAVGMAAWLRAGPDLAARGWQALPQSGETAAQLASAALDSLSRATAALRMASPGARVAMLPGWMAPVYLARLARGQGAEPSEFHRRLRLLWTTFRL